MKKIVLTLLIFISSTLVFAQPNYTYTLMQNGNNNSKETYVNNNITTPITQIGITEDVYVQNGEEKGLEVEWNAWHANVRNIIFNEITKLRFPKNYFLYYVFPLYDNQSISDVVLIYIPESSVRKEGMHIYFKQNSDFYMYVYSSNKYFKLRLANSITQIGKYTILDSVNKAERKQINSMQVPYSSVYQPIAKKIYSQSNSGYLKFPAKSKRTRVIISDGITDIKQFLSADDYTDSDFDDIERIK